MTAEQISAAMREGQRVGDVIEAECVAAGMRLVEKAQANLKLAGDEPLTADELMCVEGGVHAGVTGAFTFLAAAGLLKPYDDPRWRQVASAEPLERES